MMILLWNFIKVFTAFFIGIGLLWFIYDLPIAWISFIQMVIFTIWYSFLDWVYVKIKEAEFKR